MAPPEAIADITSTGETIAREPPQGAGRRADSPLGGDAVSGTGGHVEVLRSAPRWRSLPVTSARQVPDAGDLCAHFAPDDTVNIIGRRSWLTRHRAGVSLTNR